MNVVVMGDVNVDLEIRLPDFGGVRPHANPEPRLLGGGSAANTAAALGRLGVECVFVGSVGEDPFGAQAKESLEESGVDVGLVESTAKAPTVVVVTVVPRDGDRLIYVWPPSGGAHQEMSTKVGIGALGGADWLHVSGICLRVTPAREAVLAAMAHARKRGIRVSLDLNLRLENWGWKDGFRQTIEHAIDLADVVMGSATEEIVPLATSNVPLDAAVEVAAADRVVIARLGADGSAACSTDGVLAVPAFDVELADTVGAGDAHNAGFILGRLRGLDLEHSLRLGNAVAALTVSLPGARSTPTLDEVDELLATGEAR